MLRRLHAELRYVCLVQVSLINDINFILLILSVVGDLRAVGIRLFE